MPIKQAEGLLECERWNRADDCRLVELTKAWFHQLAAGEYDGCVNFNKMGDMLKDGTTSWQAVAAVARAVAAYEPERVGLWLAKVTDMLVADALPRPSCFFGLMLALFEVTVQN